MGAIEAPSRSHLRGCKGTMRVGSIAREEAEDGEDEKGGAEGGEEVHVAEAHMCIYAFGEGGGPNSGEREAPEDTSRCKRFAGSSNYT